MPLVTVKMLEGRTDEQKRNLVEKVTEAVKETTGVAEEKIIVMIEEMRKDHYAVAQQTDQRYGVILDNGKRCYVRLSLFHNLFNQAEKDFLFFLCQCFEQFVNEQLLGFQSFAWPPFFPIRKASSIPCGGLRCFSTFPRILLFLND